MSFPLIFCFWYSVVD